MPPPTPTQVMICCVSPLRDDLTETVSTLRFGLRASRLRTRTKVNEDSDGDVDSYAVAEQLQRALEASEAALHTAQVLAERRAGRALVLAIRFLGRRHQRPEPSASPPEDGVAVQTLQAELEVNDRLLETWLGTAITAMPTPGVGRVDEKKLTGGGGARWSCSAALLLGLAAGLALGIAAGLHQRRLLSMLQSR